MGRVFHWHKQDYAKAVNIYTEALRLAPSIRMVHYRRGRAMHAMKNYGGAELDFDAALRQDPNYSNLLLSWAWQLATCPDASYRDGDRAVKFAKQGNQSWKITRPGPLEVLAACYAEAGDFKKAVETQKKAISHLDNEDNDLRKPMQQRLHKYLANQPLRETSDRTPID